MSIRSRLDRVERQAQALLTGECLCDGKDHVEHRNIYVDDPVPPPPICAKCKKPKPTSDVIWAYMDMPPMR